MSQEAVRMTMIATAGSGVSAVLAVSLVLMIVVFEIAAMWRIFTKAGHHGWASVIPIYNVYVLLKIAGRPGWWLILLCIPLVNLATALVLYVDLAKSFAKSGLFGVGLFLLSAIYFPVLGFGSSRYRGPFAAR